MMCGLSGCSKFFLDLQFIQLQINVYTIEVQFIKLHFNQYTSLLLYVTSTLKAWKNCSDVSKALDKTIAKCKGAKSDNLRRSLDKAKSENARLKAAVMTISNIIDYGKMPDGKQVSLDGVTDILNDAGALLAECFDLNSLLKGRIP